MYCTNSPSMDLVRHSYSRSYSTVHAPKLSSHSWRSRGFAAMIWVAYSCATSLGVPCRQTVPPLERSQNLANKHTLDFTTNDTRTSRSCSVSLKVVINLGSLINIRISERKEKTSGRYKSSPRFKGPHYGRAALPKRIVRTKSARD